MIKPIPKATSGFNPFGDLIGLTFSKFVEGYHLNNLGELGPVSDRARWWHGQETGHSPEILRSYVEGHSQCTLMVEKKLLNPHGVLHGGVISTMADTGMGGALYTRLDEGESCATAEIKITYLRSVTAGTLTCDTKVIHKGRRIAFLESEVWNDERLVAKASGTYSIFPIRK